MRTIAIIVCVFAFTACKKNYTCECRNANGTYIGGETYGTKKKAEDKCSSLSAGDTKCYVK
jgi:hypothetical protein